MKKILAAIVAALAIACRGPLTVVDDTGPNGPAWVKSPNTAERVTSAADAAARVWGGTSSGLDGWSITFKSDLGDDYGVTTNNLLGNGGSVDLAAFWPKAFPGQLRMPMACAELTSLAHEVGHALFGDPDHQDPRWHSVEFCRELATAMSASVPRSDEACRAVFLGQCGPHGMRLTD